MKINEVTVKEASLGQIGAGIKGLKQGWQAAGQPNQPVKPGASGLDTAINTVSAKPKPAGILDKIGGAFQGAKAGYQAAGAAQAQTAKVKTVASQALQKWAAYNQNIKMSTGADATPEQAVAWLTQFQGGVEPTDSPTNTTPAGISQWLQKQVGAYMAQQAGYNPLPDISQLTKQELLQLKQQLQAA
jgi:hypothetical protein